MPDNPGAQQLARDHDAQADQPAWLPEQVGYQPQAQEIGLRYPLGRVLLEHETGAEQHGCE